MGTKTTKALNLLSSIGIKYRLHEHEALATVETALKYWINWDGIACKNLFLRNKKGNRHFLVVLEHDTDFSLKLLKKRIENQHFSFASEQRLEKHLGLSPGSVSPIGLLNDKENNVELIMDINLEKAKKLLFHPNENTATIEISFEDLIKLLAYTNHTIRWVNFAELEDFKD